MILLQTYQVSAQIGTPSFAKYLVSRGDYTGILDLNRYVEPGLTTQQTDSLDFYTAWAHFHLQHLEPAIDHFRDVSTSSIFFSQSQVFSSWCNLYQGNPDQAINDLHFLQEHDQTDNTAAIFQLTAIQLYKKEYNRAQTSILKLSSEKTSYQDQLEQLKLILDSGQNYQAKSKGLAAVLSAIIPGAGKIYAGETVKGISAMIIMAGLGGVVAENISNTGWTSWNSLIFSGLFGAYYLSNIYESTVSIQTYRNKFNEKYQKSILATVVIPLRDYYRQGTELP